MAKSQFDAPHFQDAEKARELLEAIRWPSGPTCPHCGGVDRIRKVAGTKHRPGLFSCRDCNGHFTVTVGTVFERSKIALNVWFQAVFLLCSSKKGISTRQLQRTLGGSMKTAWFLGHRIREMMKRNDDMFTPPIGGAGKFVEVDETYIGRKSTTKINKPLAKQQAVVSLVERNGEVRSFHVPNVKADSLRRVLANHVSRASNLRTDESTTYSVIGWNFATHETVIHSKDEYVRGDAYTNTAEGYFSILKRGIYGVFQHVSEAHLQRYLAEFDFRYSNRIKLGIDDVMRADLALQGAKGKRLTYR